MLLRHVARNKGQVGIVLSLTGRAGFPLCGPSEISVRLSLGSGGPANAAIAVIALASVGVALALMVLSRLPIVPIVAQLGENLRLTMDRTARAIIAFISDRTVFRTGSLHTCKVCWPVYPRVAVVATVIVFPVDITVNVLLDSNFCATEHTSNLALTIHVMVVMRVAGFNVVLCSIWKLIATNLTNSRMGSIT